MRLISRLGLLWTNVAMLALPAVLNAQDFRYTINNGTLTIAMYIGTNSTVIIPDSANGRMVAAIGSHAFRNCTNLTSITIGSGVTSIAESAFNKCGALITITVDASNTVYSSLGGVLFNKSQTVLITCPEGKAGSYTIPSAVTNIERLAFSGCTNLTSITIGSGVTSIAESAFNDCRALSTITVDASNAVYSSLGGVLFNKIRTVLITCPEGKAGSYTIPSTVTNIGRSAFLCCTRLANVTIPHGVTTIGDGAFWACLGLPDVIIPDGVTAIGTSAFALCTNLTNVAIPDSVTTMGGGVFWECTSLTNITICDGVTSIGLQTFSGVPKLTSVTVGSGVTNIGGGAFFECVSLRSVYFKGNAPSLGSDVFTFANEATVYHLPGTTGWGETFGRRPTAVWNLQAETNAAAGVKAN
jgi:hypothetical protein